MQQSVDNLKEFLASTGGDLWYLLPELSLVLTIVFLLLFDLVFKRNKSTGIAAISFGGLAFYFTVLIRVFTQDIERSIFQELLQISPLSTLLQILFTIVVVVALVMAIRGRSNHKDFFESSELTVMLLTLLFGAGLMVKSTNLLTIYISIELVSISSYILTGITKGKAKSEAALKYLLYGAISSAAMLYGMSWLYGLTGTLNITDDLFIQGLAQAPALPLSIAVILALVGILFKLGAFPLHVWSPDVYQAAPTPIVATFSVVPKIAALVIIMRLAATIQLDAVDWQLWLGVVAIASMTVGNFSALWQKDVKRMLAYSSIAHAGFLLTGIIAASSSGNEALLFYASIYLMMNLGAFFLVQVYEQKLDSTEFNSFRGLGTQLPFLSVLVLVVMISLTGLPPTAGFSAKLYIFSALWESYQVNGDSILLWTFIFGLVNTVVALFYYLKLPYLLFFKNSADTVALEGNQNIDRLWGTLLVLPLLLLFFKPNWFVGLLNSINFELWTP